MRHVTTIRRLATFALACLLFAGPALADPGGLQSVLGSASRTGATYTSASYPCGSAEMVSLYAAATAGGGTFSVKLQTSPDDSLWFDVDTESTVVSGDRKILTGHKRDGLGRYYRAVATVVGAAVTFSVQAVTR